MSVIEGYGGAPARVVPKVPPATTCALWCDLWQEDEVFIAGRLLPVRTGEWTVTLVYTCGQRYAVHVTAEAERAYGQSSISRSWDGSPCPAHRGQP